MTAVARGQDLRRKAPSSSGGADLAGALEVVGARWTLLIVDVLLRVGPCRFKDLTDNLAGISTNLLSERLRELEHAGVIVRTVTEPPASVVTYQLTALGSALQPTIGALASWARRLGRRERR